MVRIPSRMVPLGTNAPRFTLPDATSGQTVSIEDFDDSSALLVVFMCVHCPFVVHIREAFRDFAAEYKSRGLATIAISSNDVAAYPQDGPEAMAKEARELEYTFPYLFDESQEVARDYDAACTPDFFLFDSSRRLVYRGQFDDSRPSNERPVTGSDLRAAVDVTLGGGKPDPEGQIPSVGCNIKWKPGNEPEWFG